MKTAMIASCFVASALALRLPPPRMGAATPAIDVSSAAAALLTSVTTPVTTLDGRALSLGETIGNGTFGSVRWAQLGAELVIAKRACAPSEQQYAADHFLHVVRPEDAGIVGALQMPDVAALPGFDTPGS